MVLCICRAVTDRDLEGLVRSGARSLADVETACGAGGDCGACINALAERLKSKSPPTFPARCSDCPRALER
jgi:bacterioferritin-associated ferredoxin